VIVTGTIAQQRWETGQGEKRSTFAITAEAVGPDLAYATATVRKTAQADATSPDDPWATASARRPNPAATDALPRDPEPGARPDSSGGRTAAIPAFLDPDPPF
jgi:single-strand DNA-binding protein